MSYGKVLCWAIKYSQAHILHSHIELGIYLTCVATKDLIITDMTRDYLAMGSIKQETTINECGPGVQSQGAMALSKLPTPPTSRSLAQTTPILELDLYCYLNYTSVKFCELGAQSRGSVAPSSVNFDNYF